MCPSPSMGEGAGEGDIRDSCIIRVRLRCACDAWLTRAAWKATAPMLSLKAGQVLAEITRPAVRPFKNNRTTESA